MLFLHLNHYSEFLLKTNQGERLFQPNLGMNLREFLFEQMSDDTTIQIENNIVDVFGIWLPFVELRNIEINKKDDLNQVSINIEFNIRRSPGSLESVEITFNGVGGGSGGSVESGGNTFGGGY